MLVFLLTLSSKLSCQEIYGLAYYQSATDVKFDDFEGKKMTKAKKQQFIQMMKDYFKKEYLLSFTNSESLYKKTETLEHPMSNGKMGYKLGMFTDGPQYKNINTKEFLQSQEFLGKLFLIKDKLPPLNWKISSETKKIGKYTCYKATAIKEINHLDWKSSATGTKESIVSAWFTTDIPIAQGPSDFWGLPGLILEVSFDRTSIICTKIIMNSSKNQRIQKFKKGQVVTIKEYNNITEKKLEDIKTKKSGRTGLKKSD